MNENLVDTLFAGNKRLSFVRSRYTEHIPKSKLIVDAPIRHSHMIETSCDRVVAANRSSVQNDLEESCRSSHKKMS